AVKCSAGDNSVIQPYKIIQSMIYLHSLILSLPFDSHTPIPLYLHTFIPLSLPCNTTSSSPARLPRRQPSRCAPIQSVRRGKFPVARDHLDLTPGLTPGATDMPPLRGSCLCNNRTRPIGSGPTLLLKPFQTIGPLYLYTSIPLYLYTYFLIHLYTYTPIYLYTYTPISLSIPN